MVVVGADVAQADPHVRRGRRGRQQLGQTTVAGDHRRAIGEALRWA